jgi:4-aminobutyrate aminotransferase-like enzyme
VPHRRGDQEPAVLLRDDRERAPVCGAVAPVVVLSPVLGHHTWLEVDHGEGSWLVARDGRRVLDLTSGIAVTPVGQAHPKFVAAIQAQAAELAHMCAGVAAYEPNIALAEALADITPSGLDMMFFGNSGAEAVEAAITLVAR